MRRCFIFAKEGFVEAQSKSIMFSSKCFFVLWDQAYANRGSSAPTVDNDGDDDDDAESSNDVSRMTPPPTKP